MSDQRPTGPTPADRQQAVRPAQERAESAPLDEQGYDQQLYGDSYPPGPDGGPVRYQDAPQYQEDYPLPLPPARQAPYAQQDQDRREARTYGPPNQRPVANGRQPAYPDPDLYADPDPAGAGYPVPPPGQSLGPGQQPGRAGYAEQPGNAGYQGPSQDEPRYAGQPQTRPGDAAQPQARPGYADLPEDQAAMSGQPQGQDGYPGGPQGRSDHAGSPSEQTRYPDQPQVRPGYGGSLPGPAGHQQPQARPGYEGADFARHPQPGQPQPQAPAPQFVSEPARARPVAAPGPPSPQTPSSQTAVPVTPWPPP